MRIKCNVGTIESKRKLTSNEEDYFKKWKILPDKLFLTLGEEYNVYAIEYTEQGYERFYITDDSGRIFPTAYPSDFFEVREERLSKSWGGAEKQYSDIKPPKLPYLLSFKEWMENEFFWGEMVDNEGRANDIFKKYKKIMDLEYRNGNYPSAFYIEKDLYICYQCDFAIASTDELEMLECPKCKAIQNKG